MREELFLECSFSIFFRMIVNISKSGYTYFRSIANYFRVLVCFVLMDPVVFPPNSSRFSRFPEVSLPLIHHPFVCLWNIHYLYSHWISCQFCFLLVSRSISWEFCPLICSKSTLRFFSIRFSKCLLVQRTSKMKKFTPNALNTVKRKHIT